MTQASTPARPLRVAVVGAGPAGFYVAERFLLKGDVPVQLDMYERLPTPYGLVRFGVAPDHEKIKNVTRVFDKVAAHPGFRFFGNVEVGRDLSLGDLARYYHQICFTTGAQTDHQMGIPGEDLERSHSATEFVAWYNGHPEFRDRVFDLAVERVAVVGVGNVAVDVARMLCRTPEELETTDVADYALEALRRSPVREVTLLGRRGPAQAAFTNPEVRELGEMPGADIRVLPEEVELDPVSRRQLEANEDKGTEKKLEILRDFAARERVGKPKLLTIRFLVSPIELIGDAAGCVIGMRMMKNVLVEDDGRIRPRPTGVVEELPVEMVFRSVGYRGVPLDGLPFDERSGVVPNERGRVVDPASGTPVRGVYVSGWIKRGPTGVIGTNKPDAVETVETMIEDVTRGAALEPAEPDPGAIERFVRRRCPRCVSYPDWLRIAEVEASRGKALGRPRVKFTTVEEMLRALEEE